MSLLQEIHDRCVTTDNGCTDWLGVVDKNGYPSFHGRASRTLWALTHGDIPPGFVVRHKCDNPRCLRLTHLLLGTPKQNTADGIQRLRLRGARKIPFDAVSELNTLRREGWSLKDLAAKYKVSWNALYAYFEPDVKRKGKYARGARHWAYKGGVSPRVRASSDEPMGQAKPR